MNELYNGDCLEVMQKLIDDGVKVDMILTDPPYIINYKTSLRNDKSHRFCKTIVNDDDIKLIERFVLLSYKILKDNTAMYMFCSSKKQDVFKNILTNSGFIIKNIIIWVKNNWTAGDLKSSFGNQYEVIFLVNKGDSKIIGKRLSDVWAFDRVSGKALIHQNQKPLLLLAQCIKHHSKENNLILDPFMGSGSTCVACIKTNRRFIGIELDKEYFDIASRRIEDAKKELENKLF